jgi:serine/threonine-protein kinase
VLRPGDRIGDWIVERPLGEGGMGAVYRVHSALTQRLVAALKVMKPSVEPDARARFIREAEALASLRHPAVVRVMEFAEDTTHGLVYLVMELAVGETLRQRLQRGPMDLREAISVFLPLAQGLDHAHQSGVFHRDIKPSNIILCNDGTVRLVDFGIAAAQDADPITDTGQLGTLAYLPPEVFRAERAMPSSVDVYAFGLLLHEALTGVRSFPVDPNLTPAAAAAAVGVRKLQSEPMEVGERFPEKLRDLVRRATAPNPAERPAMREVRSSLETLVERRGRSGDTTAHGRLMPLPPGPMVTDEHTMRVPDPTDKPIAGRSWVGVPRRLMIGGALAALVLGAGAALVARSPDHEPRAVASEARQPAQPVVDGPGRMAPAPPASAAVPPFASPAQNVTSPAPGGSPAPATTASAAAASPAANQSPAAGPTPAAGSASPAPAATPRPKPTATPAQPADEGDLGPTEPDDDGSTQIPSDDGSVVAGRWDLTHEVEATSYAAYSGLRVGYRLTLQQDGNHVYGRGRKYTENGVLLPPDQRTAITVDGQIEGQYLVLNFTEQGAWRTSSGTIRWLISPGAGALQGRFASDAAQSSGTSVARRVR